IGTALSAVLLTSVPLIQGTASAGTWWSPGTLQSWAYVIGENYPLTIPPIVDGTVTNVQAVDSDLGDEDGLTSSGMPIADASIESSVAAVHAMGGHAICYVDVGGAENYRSDFSEFDPSELGSPEPGWPDEQWINVTDWSAAVPAPYETIEQIMSNRIALCKEEGFDAMEPDNDDAYSNDPLGGFSLTMGEDETYLEDLAAIAHSDGLAIFLKNGINGDSFVSDMEPYVDGAINEQCWQYSECSELDVFVQAGKPILNVEYQSFAESTLCPEALAFPMASIQAGVDLTGPINYGCWQYGSQTTTTNPSSSSAPTTAAPTTNAPTTAAPTTAAPTTAAPTTAAPTTAAPTTAAPTTAAPTTAAPTTAAPTTAAPTTVAPTTDAPTTAAPTTAAPTTAAPTTAAPTTAVPTTAAPTTAAPTTAAPTTDAPTTDAPTTDPPTTGATSTSRSTTSTTGAPDGSQPRDKHGVRTGQIRRYPNLSPPIAIPPSAGSSGSSVVSTAQWVVSHLKRHHHREKNHHLGPLPIAPNPSPPGRTQAP
ncbi:MAG TPA: endo alpha-1,4 polygalactosaminidase, partial [Acidimicrobiales bacterium]|nr:endo alpha-1,4 polygalactosaminidase [Acidimicrobiales bacterium]